MGSFHQSPMQQEEQFKFLQQTSNMYSLSVLQKLPSSLPKTFSSNCPREWTAVSQYFSTVAMTTLHVWARDGKSRKRGLCLVSWWLLPLTSFCWTVWLLAMVANVLSLWEGFEKAHCLLHYPVLEEVNNKPINHSCTCSSYLFLMKLDIFKLNLTLSALQKADRQVCHPIKDEITNKKIAEARHHVHDVGLLLYHICMQCLQDCVLLRSPVLWCHTLFTEAYNARCCFFFC